MPSTAILREVQNLHEVSDRLDQLANEHEGLSVLTALTTISGNVRQLATLLEVLVLTKLGPPEGGPANA